MIFLYLNVDDIFIFKHENDQMEFSNYINQKILIKKKMYKKTTHLHYI